MPLPDGDAVFGRSMTTPWVSVAGEVPMGASSSLPITWDRLKGLTDLPRLFADSPAPARLVDPGVPLWADLGWRQIVAENLQVQGDAALAALRSVMLDRSTVRPLVFADHALVEGVDLMVAVVADRLEYDRWAQTHTDREYRPALQWLALDPTIYTAAWSDTAWESAGTTRTTSVVNIGRDVVRTGRGMSLRIEAVTTVTSPRIRVVHPGGEVEQITWQGLVIHPGQALTVGADRTPRIGSRVVSASMRSPNGSGPASRAPRWPEWHPGPPDDLTRNVVTVSAASGTWTGRLRTRSGW